jgi:AAA domain-containing protein
MRKQLPERRNMLGNWLHTGEAAMIWSASGTGKTWLSMDASITIAGGGTLGPWSSNGGFKVLTIDGEMSPHDMQSRLRKLLDLKDHDSKELALDNITLMARTIGQKPNQPFVCLTDEAHRIALMNDVLALKPDLVVLDNISTLTLGGDGTMDENDAGAMGPINEMILRFKAANIATLVVHHSKKNGESYRGSSALEATFDYIIGLTKPEGEVFPQGRAGFQLNFNKDRSGNPQATESALWGLGDLGWTVHKPQADKVEKLTELLKTHRYISQDELAAATGVSKGEISKRLGKARSRHIMSESEIALAFKKAREDREDEVEEIATDKDFDPDLDSIAKATDPCADY